MWLMFNQSQYGSTALHHTCTILSQKPFQNFNLVAAGRPKIYTSHQISHRVKKSEQCLIDSVALPVIQPIRHLLSTRT